MAVKMREAKTGFKFSVVSRFVTIRNSSGKRIRNAKWGQPIVWNKSPELGDNIKMAIMYHNKFLHEKHLGGIVHLIQSHGRGIPHDTQEIFQAKWGNDNKPFMAFNGVAGEYWRRKLGMTKIKSLLYQG